MLGCVVVRIVVPGFSSSGAKLTVVDVTGWNVSLLVTSDGFVDRLWFPFLLVVAHQGRWEVSESLPVLVFAGLSFAPVLESLARVILNNS